MSASRLLLCCWAALAVLSSGTLLLARSGPGAGLSMAILLLALGKAWLISEGFMELRHAPRLWRCLLLGWPLALLASVALTLMLLRGNT